MREPCVDQPMIAPARHPRIDEPVETRRQIFDHTARLPSPRTGNGWHHPQSAAGPMFMREPCPPMPDEPSTPEICDRPSEKHEQLSATPGNLTLSRPFKGFLLPSMDDLRSRIPSNKGLREGRRESVHGSGGWRAGMAGVGG